jgi:hypothetical protein
MTEVGRAIDAGGWAIRVVGHDMVAPDQLLANPRNWRLHPRSQQQALDEAVAEVGFIRSVTVNRRTGFIVDGHLRVERALAAGVTAIPVEYVDLSEEEEWKALLFFDPIAALATKDEAALAALRGEVDLKGEQLRKLADDLTGGAKETSDGSLLALVDVTIGEPRHQVAGGDVWRVGPHILICADVMAGWPVWADYLQEGTLFVPYPGPFVPLSLRADETALVLVQPDPYIAGHLLDRYADVRGEEAVGLEQRTAEPGGAR